MTQLITSNRNDCSTCTILVQREKLHMSAADPESPDMLVEAKARQDTTGMILINDDSAKKDF